MIKKILDKMRNWMNGSTEDYDHYDNEDLDSYDAVMQQVSMTFPTIAGIPSLSNISPSVANVNIISSGSGYNSIPSITLGPNISSAQVSLSNGLWSINTAQITPDTSISGELILNAGTDNPIRIVETLNTILDQCGIILPNKKLHEEYPALKTAWEDYNEEFQKTTRSKSLQDSIDNYKIIKSLIKNHEE